MQLSLYLSEKLYYPKTMMGQEWFSMVGPMEDWMSEKANFFLRYYVSIDLASGSLILS